MIEGAIKGTVKGWLQDVCTNLPYSTKISYLILEQIIPGLATQRISDNEFKDIQRDVEDDAVEPNYASPSPPNSANPRKAPICIHSNDGGHLNKSIRKSKSLSHLCVICKRTISATRIRIFPIYSPAVL
jgi:hypothetical protein